MADIETCFSAQPSEAGPSSASIFVRRRCHSTQCPSLESTAMLVAPALERGRRLAFRWAFLLPADGRRAPDLRSLPAPAPGQPHPDAHPIPLLNRNFPALKRAAWMVASVGATGADAEPVGTGSRSPRPQIATLSPPRPLGSSWAVLEGKITIVREAASHEKTGGTGACGARVRMSRRTFRVVCSLTRPRRYSQEPYCSRGEIGQVETRRLL